MASTTKPAITLVMALFSCLCWAQPKDMDFYDNDRNGKLNQDEFDDMMRKIELFSALDINDNGFISLEEFNHGLDNLYPEKDLYSYDRYLRWDMNSDHFIKDEEFWIGLFKLWDEDGDHYVGQAEYNNWRYNKKIKDLERAGEKQR